MRCLLHASRPLAALRTSRCSGIAADRRIVASAPVRGLSVSTAAAATSPSAAMKLIDIGSNLADSMYQGVYHDKKYHEPDLDDVLSRAWDNGVEKIMITAGSLAEGEEALAMAQTNDKLFSTVGVHPTRCGNFEEEGGDGPDAYLASLVALALNGGGKVVAVGECGLDYDRLQFCDAETQKKYFEAQFALTEATGLPMFLHMRAACDDFLDIMRANRGRWTQGVVHSFDGTADELRAILEVEGLSVGINGCSLKTEENLGVAAQVPLDRLMLETDAPWCDIRNTHAGKPHVETTWQSKDKKKHAPGDGLMVKGRNEPCTMVQVLEVVAGARGVDKEELAAQVYENTRKMFFPGSE